MTGRVRDMILDPEQTGQLQTVIAEGEYYGMQTFDQALLKHLQAGRVSMEDALRVATSPHDFKLLVAGDGRTATSVSGGVNRYARTDAGGRFTITFPGGEGDYFMGFTAIGFTPRRFEVKRTADQEILVADARMQRAAALLDTVRVAADRNRDQLGQELSYRTFTTNKVYDAEQ